MVICYYGNNMWVETIPLTSVVVLAGEEYDENFNLEKTGRILFAFATYFAGTAHSNKKISEFKIIGRINDSDIAQTEHGDYIDGVRVITTSLEDTSSLRITGSVTVFMSK